MYKRLNDFLKEGWISLDDKTLVVCGGEFDQNVLEALGFKNYTISSMYEEETCEIKNYKKEDAECLSFEDSSFDNVIVHAGLHHCYSPHQALCEMFRVASKNVIVFESQDSILMRLFERLGFVLEYELDAVIASQGRSGGVNNLPIPNYVYRWTPREVEKIIRALDPIREPDVLFYREFYFHHCLFRRLSKEKHFIKDTRKTCNTHGYQVLYPDPKSALKATGESSYNNYKKKAMEDFIVG